MPEVVAADRLHHMLLLYRGIADYRTAVTRFTQAGLTRGEPVLFAIPQARAVLRNWVGGNPGLVTMTDMTEVGRNPARVIPALRAFADRHLGQRVRIVCESVWADRSPAEVSEAARHEALVDRALAGVAGTMVCPYSAADLPESVLADAACTHQWQLGSGTVLPSTAYAGPDTLPAACRQPLPSPPPDAYVIEYHRDLRPVRALVAGAAQRAGLPASRITDLILAASEVAANTLRHTRGGGVAQTWQAKGEIICQLADSGFISDALAGLLQPSPDAPGGQGLWLVNQVCDLVEIRSRQDGTLVRLHMRLPCLD